MQVVANIDFITCSTQREIKKGDVFNIAATMRGHYKITFPDGTVSDWWAEDNEVLTIKK